MDAAARPSRRTLLAGGLGIAGAAALSGCGPAASGSARSTGGDSGVWTDPSGVGQVLAKTAAVPVGGAISGTHEGVPIVIAQPTSGTIVAFSAICTHQGCTVAPAGTRFECPCHGSIYEAATGAVLQGPAVLPLTKLPVHTANGDVLADA